MNFLAANLFSGATPRPTRRAISALAGFVALVALCGGGWLIPARAADDLEMLEEKAIRQAVEQVAPSVLKIETVGGMEKIGEFLVGTGPTTGLVVDPEGYVISSAFNFAQKPASILVTLPDGTRSAAQLIATDHSRMIVLLKVKTDKPLPLPTAAPIQEAQVGQWALALGRTYEGTRPSLSAGIVSALNRVWGKAIQTDAKISPTNYGGPLIDIRGRVLGVLVPMNPMAADEASGVEWYDSGIGFAIPLDQIQRILPRLKKGEDLYPGLLGISMKGKDIFSDAAEIAAVLPNSPAAKADFKPGDKIIELDGKPIVNQSQMRHALAPHYANETVKVVVLRGSDKIAKDLELVAKLTAYQHPFLGVLPLRNPQDKNAPGVTVRFVYEKSPAQAAGIKAGDRIVSLDGKEVASRDALLERLSSLLPGGKVRVEIARAVENQPPEKKSFEIALAAQPLDVPAALPAARSPRKAFEGERPDVGVLHIKIPDEANECMAFVPENYDPEVAYGVVIWLHPPRGYNEEELLDRWKKACADRDLILLAPKAAEAQRWQKSELAFLRKAFDEINRNYHVDPARVVAHGQEGGAVLAYLLAFAHRDAIRGVAAVDSALPQGVQPPSSEPGFRFAVFSASSEKSPSAKQVTAGLDKLKAAKIPVTNKALKEPGKYLNPGEFSELIRWLDALDKM